MTNIAAITALSGKASLGSAGPAKAVSGVSAFDQILEDLKKIAQQTPMERARAEVLKKHSMSEDDYARLPTSQRSAIDKEIAEAVRKVAEAQMKSAPTKSASIMI